MPSSNNISTIIALSLIAILTSTLSANAVFYGGSRGSSNTIAAEAENNSRIRDKRRDMENIQRMASTALDESNRNPYINNACAEKLMDKELVRVKGRRFNSQKSAIKTAENEIRIKCRF